VETELDKLIYDWNRDGRAARADYRAVELDDETLRDGLQGPSVRNPPLDVKRRLLQLMDQLGIDSADLGLPGASPQARATIVALAKETTKLKHLRPNLAIRTHPDDVRAAIEASTEAGIPIEKHLLVPLYADNPAELKFERPTFDLFRRLRRSEIWRSAKRVVDPEAKSGTAPA